MSPKMDFVQSASFVFVSYVLSGVSGQLSQIFYMCPEMERNMVLCGDTYKIHQDDIASFPVNLVSADKDKQKRICSSGEIMSASKCLEDAITEADCSAMDYETGTSIKDIMTFNGTTSAAERFCESMGTKYNLQAVYCFGGGYRHMSKCMDAYGPAMEAEARKLIQRAKENQEVLEISICLSYHIYKWCTEVAMETCPEARDYVMDVQHLITPPVCQKYHFGLTKVGYSLSGAARSFSDNLLCTYLLISCFNVIIGLIFR